MDKDKAQRLTPANLPDAMKRLADLKKEMGRDPRVEDYRAKHPYNPQGLAKIYGGWKQAIQEAVRLVERGGDAIEPVHVDPLDILSKLMEMDCESLQVLGDAIRLAGTHRRLGEFLPIVDRAIQFRCKIKSPEEGKGSS